MNVWNAEFHTFLIFIYLYKKYVQIEKKNGISNRNKRKNKQMGTNQIYKSLHHKGNHQKK